MCLSREINEHIARMKDENKIDRIILTGMCIYKGQPFISWWWFILIAGIEILLLSIIYFLAITKCMIEYKRS